MFSKAATILIVDDHPENIVALETMLGDLNQTIVKLGSAGEALKYLSEHEVAIILLDVKMPCLSGFETAKLIRQSENSKLIPIIFTTAVFTKEINEAQGYALGAVDFIRKPFVAAILRAKVSVFVDLFSKTQEIKDQAELITAMERKRLQECAERLETASRLLQEDLLRKEAEQALLIDRSLKLQNSDQLKTEFLANMSHEIRTPMHAIVGFTELLVKSDLTAEQQELAAYIGTSAQSLLILINDILDLSKIEAGKLDLEVVECDMSAIVEGTTSLLAESARSKGLNLMTFVDTELPAFLKGDPGRLRQILLNLASNAIKFTDQGEVVVRCQRVDNAQDPAGSVTIRISITDTGIGISAEKRAHLFKPFSQADGSTTRRYGGTGLGLSISKRLVELMGGEIGVDSELGKGASFWFKITLAIGSSVPSSTEKFSGAKRRILVIDAQDSARKIMEAYAKSWNMECDLATSAGEGLSLMRGSVADKSPYDIVITEQALPDMDGFQLREIMNKDADLCRLNTMLVSGFGLKDQGKEALSSGFSAHLTKPLEKSRLFNAMSLVLNNHMLTGSTGQLLVPDLPPEPEICLENLILLAEDNPVNQRVATLQLRQLGLNCVTVSNGSDAVEEVSRGIYSLVLMDCQMPVMDGFQATRMVRNAEVVNGCHIPIVGLTAYAMETDRERCISAGMDDFVSKPSSFGKLCEVLKQWLPNFDKGYTVKTVQVK